MSSGAGLEGLDRLEHAGLIERRSNPEDRRGSLIVPEQSGTGKIALWFASARQAQDELISGYSESELEIIVYIFERFTKLWDQEREKIQKGQ